MKQLFKVKLGFIGFIVGLVGAGFAAGAEPVTIRDWINVVGVAVTSLMLMQLGVWLIKEEI